MGYKDFLYAVEEELNNKLKEGGKASVYTAVKNNGREKKGVMIERPGSNVAPTIYLDGYYVRFQRGEPMTRLVEEIMTFYDSVSRTQIWDYSQYEEYKEIKDRVVFKLVHYSKNQELLSRVPNVDILDLSIIFYVLLDVGKNGMATILISNEHMEKWGIKKEELFLTALQNVKTLLPAEFFTMRHAIEEVLESTKDDEAENLLNKMQKEKKEVMYILTNSIRSYGAACMAYPHVLEMIGDMLREDFYILPCSVHEVIIVPESKGLKPEEMDEMIMEINETQVEPEEVLSDHAYFYQREGKQLRLSRKEEAECGI